MVGFCGWKERRRTAHPDLRLATSKHFTSGHTIPECSQSIPHSIPHEDIINTIDIDCRECAEPE